MSGAPATPPVAAVRGQGHDGAWTVRAGTRTRASVRGTTNRQSTATHRTVQVRDHTGCCRGMLHSTVVLSKAQFEQCGELCKYVIVDNVLGYFSLHFSPSMHILT